MFASRTSGESAQQELPSAAVAIAAHYSNYLEVNSRTRQIGELSYHLLQLVNCHTQPNPSVSQVPHHDDNKAILPLGSTDFELT